MKTSAQVVVIGGGVIGASILYHLTKNGWNDVVLVERKELTAGSTWHSAGGMHTLNGNPNVAALQKYTIELYQEIEKISGQDCGLHLTGGLMLAATARLTHTPIWLVAGVGRALPEPYVQAIVERCTDPELPFLRSFDLISAGSIDRIVRGDGLVVAADAWPAPDTPLAAELLRTLA